MSTPTPTWGRVHRGVVWHLLVGQAAEQWPVVRVDPGAWCGTDEAFAEVTAPRPPRGARPCPRCSEAFDRYANELTVAREIAAALLQEIGNPQPLTAADAQPTEEPTLDALPEPEPALDREV